MLLGIQIIPRINGHLQSQPRAIIVWQHLLVALCESLWTLSGSTAESTTEPTAESTASSSLLFVL